MSIYKGDNKVTGTGVQVDTALSSTSTHAVTNAAITDALTEVGYSEWRKPDDWVDIRSGALPNSIYFLVAHSAPTGSEGSYSVSTHSTFRFTPYVDNTGSCDVYVDGIKIATTTHGEQYVITWEDLYNNGTLVSGNDITYPSSLVSHVVRVTPTDTANAIYRMACTSSYNTGLLWIHLTFDSIDARDYSVSSSSSLLEAITTTSGEWHLVGNNLFHAFLNSENIKALPVFIGDSSTSYTAVRAFEGNKKIKNIVLKNIKMLASNDQSNFYNMQALREIKTINSSIGPGRSFLQACYALKKIPTLDWAGSVTVTDMLSGSTKLENSIIDASSGHLIKRLTLGGYEAASFVDGIKGVLVSNQAPFDSATSPQLSVKYSGLSRAALVNLFKSLPYNVGYTVVGSPTITNGVLTGLTNSTDGISLPALPDNINSFEFVTKVKTRTSATQSFIGSLPAGSSTQQFIIANSTASYFFWNFKHGAENDTDYRVSFDSTIPTDTELFIKATMTRSGDNYIYTLGYSTDGETYTSASVTSSYKLSKETMTSLQMCSWRAYTSGGATVPQYIDLNQTYININGIPWFRGTAAMTKTVSVVGCAGTADLTAADKAIAEDKGWAITLS